ncbi:MAG TPA: cation diffusion facilitator family transporter [Alphaproteobacteria bacterium]|nr:cation diffusion facilitator family transporter [Alphaproteobacteria bacterium]
MWATKWSFFGLLVTAVLQLVVVALSGSVALLADTIHNVGDAATAVPLGIAFLLVRWQPTKRLPYGYGRVEDLAGVAILLVIVFTAVVALYETVHRLFHPQTVAYLWAVMAASVIGFVGNEAVAIFRFKVGKEIGSAALVADGYHARIDGWTSLAVLAGALGMWWGYPLADPIVGLLITAAIFWLAWQSGTLVLMRIVDGVDPEVIDDLTRAVRYVPGVQTVTEVRARWLGHRLRGEVNIAVAPALSVAQAHAIAKEVRHRLLYQVCYLADVTIHVDPVDEAGERYHRIVEHAHDGLVAHSH